MNVPTIAVDGDGATEAATRSTAVVKNWSYGAKAPVIEKGEVERQMRLGFEYRNKLCELERERRERVDATLVALHHGCAAAKRAELEAFATLEAVELKAKAMPLSDELRLERDVLVSTLQVAWKALGDERKRAFAEPDVKAACDERQRDFYAQTKTLRGEFSSGRGLYWGTYLLAEDAMSDSHKGPPPRFLKWDGRGAIGFQFQKGISLEDLVAEGRAGTRVEIPPLTHESLAVRGRASGAKAMCLLHIRCGGRGRQPIIAVIPFYMHRPFPAGARCKQIKVLRKRCGANWEWKVLFVLSIDSPSRPAPNNHLVAIHPGWRMLRRTGDLRVCVWAGSDGACGEITIPPARMDRLEACRGIRSIRDRRLERFKTLFAAWIRCRSNGSLPEWLAEACSHVRLWRSPARVSVLWSHWKDHRFAGDEVAFRYVSWVRSRDRHLWSYEVGRQRRFERWRQDYYRKAMRALEAKYGFAVTSKLNFAELSVGLHSEAADKPRPIVVRRSRIASPGILTTAALEAFGKHRQIEVACASITERCHACGAIEQWNHATELEHTCGTCGTRWDQDYNACMNMLASGQVVMESRQSLANHEPKGDTTANGHATTMGGMPQQDAARKTRRNRKRLKVP